jgi:hypothetical protein
MNSVADRLEAEERLKSIKDALESTMRPAKPLYVPTAVELLVALNQRGLKIVRADASA